MKKNYFRLLPVSLSLVFISTMIACQTPVSPVSTMVSGSTNPATTLSTLQNNLLTPSLVLAPSRDFDPGGPATELFESERKYGFKSESGNLVIDSTGHMLINSDSIGNEGVFTVEIQSGDSLALKSSQDLYMTENEGIIRFEKVSTIDAKQIFKVVNVNGKVVFQASSENYLVVGSNGELTMSPTLPGERESFEIIILE